MREAVSVTQRRRELQMAYNREHGIDPQTIRKSVTDILERLRGTSGGVARAGRSRAEVRKNAAVRGNRRPPLLAEGDASTPAAAMELMGQLEAEMKAAAAEPPLRGGRAAPGRDRRVARVHPRMSAQPLMAPPREKPAPTHFVTAR